MATNEKKFLLGLLDIAITESSALDDMIAKTARFYFSITLGMCGFLLAFKQYSDNTTNANLFVIVGILMILVGIGAYYSLKSLYRRALETITFRAKVEDCLGLTDSESYHSKNYWSSEPLITLRYLKSRCSRQTSQEFVDQYLSCGFISIARTVFPCLICGIGIITFIIGVYDHFST